MAVATETDRTAKRGQLQVAVDAIRGRSGRPAGSTGDPIADVTTGTVPDALAVPVAALVVWATATSGWRGSGGRHFVRVHPGHLRPDDGRDRGRRDAQGDQVVVLAGTALDRDRQRRERVAKDTRENSRSSPWLMSDGHPRWRARRDHRAVRVGQVDAARDQGHARATDVGEGALPRRGSHDHVGCAPSRASLGVDRVRLQQFFLLDSVTAGERRKGMHGDVAGAERRRAGDRQLEAVRLAGEQGQQLSGGERERVRSRACGRLRSCSRTSRRAASTASGRRVELRREDDRAGTTIAVITHSEPVAAQATRRIRILDGRVGPRAPTRAAAANE